MRVGVRFAWAMDVAVGLAMFVSVLMRVRLFMGMGWIGWCIMSVLVWMRMGMCVAGAIRVHMRMLMLVSLRILMIMRVRMVVMLLVGLSGSTTD
jgi:hypothetical protein